MNLKEYRLNKGLTQKELAEELNLPGVDAPLISKVEKGICSLNETAEKALANPFEMGIDAETINVSSSIKKLLNQPIYRIILTEIKKGTKSHPTTREVLVARTKLTDREVRRAIQELRMNGMRIASSSSVRGYWMCSDQEFKEIKEELLCKSKSLYYMAMAMQKGCEDQLELEI